MKRKKASVDMKTSLDQSSPQKLPPFPSLYSHSLFLFHQSPSPPLIPTHIIFSTTRPTMFQLNAAANGNSGKRKMNEFVGHEQTANQFDLFNFPGGRRLFASPTHPPPPFPANGRPSQVQQILNNTAPIIRPTIRPFSFMSLLNADDNAIEEEEDDYPEDPLATEIRSQSEQVNQILSLHTDILRQALDGMLERQHKTIHRVAEESANKKLETKTRSLKARLENANMARRYGEPAHEEGDSSTEDPTDRDAGPVKLDCKVCDRQLATMLVWPCRHVCVCKQCEADTKYCPVCRVMKLTSVEVFLSLKQD